MTSLVINVPGEYASLGLVMQSALEQASRGKGKERHAEDGEAYEDQIICEVARRVGLGYPLGQATKKIYESQRLIPQLGVQELLGAMNYLGAAVIVMQERMDEEGRRFREGFAHAEGGCCQNGKDQPEAEGNCCQNGNSSATFKPGDPVEWFCFRREDAVTGWHLAFYLCKSEDTDYHIVQGIDGRYHVVHYANLRNPEAEFKPGDKVEALSFDGTRWEEAIVERTEIASGRWHCTVRLASGERHCLPVAGSIRRPPKAEGCEELVQKDLHEDCEGCLYKTYADSHAEEHDAPRTPEETCQRIVDNNPATYGQPRTPTGEELAEMAEEEEKHG